jgi:hypothetical protein
MFLKTTLTCGNKPGCRWGFEVSRLGEGHCLGPRKYVMSHSLYVTPPTDKAQLSDVERLNLGDAVSAF